MSTSPPPRIAIYPGSFDPLTNGHVDIIERGSRLFDRIVVAILLNIEKAPLFTVDERVEIARDVFRDNPKVEVDTFDGLLVDYARAKGASAIVRGLRAATDFEYELQIAHANADMGPGVDTVFLPTRANYGFISASLVREIASHDGNVGHYAPEAVAQALREKFAQKKA